MTEGISRRIMSRRMMSRNMMGKIVKVLVLGTFTILLAFPFYWMLITSFKQNVDLYTMENNPFIFNAKPTLDHVKFLFTETRFVRWLGNTAFVGVIVVAITLLLAVPAAYSLARLRVMASMAPLVIIGTETFRPIIGFSTSHDVMPTTLPPDFWASICFTANWVM